MATGVTMEDQCGELAAQLFAVQDMIIEKRRVASTAGCRSRN